MNFKGVSLKRFLSLIIKPTLFCNIDCKHCYHGSEERKSDTIEMSYLEKIIRLASEEYESVWFIWHGGEPLTLPLKFYRDAIDLQHKYFGKESHRVGNTIQTNGTNIDKKFANFCRDNQINIGISYEGPFNDILRENTEEVDKNIKFLKEKDYVFSVNSTISLKSVSKQMELYEYFKNKEVTLSLSPVLPLGCSVSSKFIPPSDEYIQNSIKTYDRWLFDKDTNIPLMPHYLYFLNALGESVEADCAHNSCLTKWLCIYPNGDLYPCAKKCPSDFKLGNINDIDNIGEAFSSDGFKKILVGSISRRDKCKECEIFSFCNGGCSIDAFYEGEIENNCGYSCNMYKEIFLHVMESAENIMKNRPDLKQYNKFIRDAVLGKLINPRITSV